MIFKSLFIFLMLVVAAFGVCDLPMSEGLCFGYLERWYHSEGDCKSFVYSGCGGNDNNFDTRESCEQTCLYKSN